MHIEHKAGEEVQVDCARSDHVLCYAYSDTKLQKGRRWLSKRKLASWIDAHARAYEYFRGVPSRKSIYRASTVLAGKIAHAKWYDLFPDPTIADAIIVA